MFEWLTRCAQLDPVVTERRNGGNLYNIITESCHEWIGDHSKVNVAGTHRCNDGGLFRDDSNLNAINCYLTAPP